MGNTYRKGIKFEYKNKMYQMFFSQRNKLAFLEIGKDGTYHYPELKELLEITSVFYVDTETVFIKNEKFKFSPKVKIGGTILILSAAFIAECISNTAKYRRDYLAEYNANQAATSYESTQETPVKDSDITPVDILEELSKNENQEATQEEVETETEEIETTKTNTSESEYEISDEINEKYLKLLALADDEYDNEFANDYEALDSIKMRYIRDSKSYEKIFGYSNVTVDQIIDACNKNPNISQKYKDFIIQYVKDWLKLYPGSDFTILYHNLETLNVKEVTSDEMLFAALSASSQACYKKFENTIYVLNDISFDKNSDDYIILSHELTHCARTTVYVDNDGYKNYVQFFNDSYDGYWDEEALITNFCYEMQGLDRESIYYTLQYNYYRLILDCIDFNGKDFMNHSVNHLVTKMDEFMETQEAHIIVPMIDCQTILRYQSAFNIDFTEFDDINDYLTRMYMKKYLTPDMSYEEARGVYDNMMKIITCQFENLRKPYDINLDVFEETFEKCASDLGIEKGVTKGM